MSAAAELPSKLGVAEGASGLAEIIKAIARVRDECGRIEKDGWNDFHKYKFVSESALTRAIQPLLAKHGLVIIPSLAADFKPYIDEKGVTHMVCEFTLAHISGAVWPEKIRVFASGDDHNKNGHGDKGAYKANTGAYKYFLSRLFMVDTGDDPERDGSKKKPAARKRESPLPKAEPPRKDDDVKLATPKQINWLKTVSYAHAEKLSGQPENHKLAASMRKAAYISLGFGEPGEITLAAASGPMINAIQATVLDEKRGEDHAMIPDGPPF